MTSIDERARIVRDAWTTGVTTHFPGDPKPSYVAPWDETPEWGRQAATAVYDQVRAFIDVTDGATIKLTREQKGRYVLMRGW
ncbi:hypothetical protein GCM10012275_43390 [Longimycelium tulufanense]|uniref:Uncharacterized protein n=1 Tax=Longimycelium tulufanense TaxID=907463 RepID=A0A8J3CB39_9PSEU|nr:hypothetical protein [Longimycelium tulufanense]GGM68183.1 hypothetical protein GCM10012275_43390 [Longimycelium tulufanense]